QRAGGTAARRARQPAVGRVGEPRRGPICGTRPVRQEARGPRIAGRRRGRGRGRRPCLEAVERLSRPRRRGAIPRRFPGEPAEGEALIVVGGLGRYGDGLWAAFKRHACEPFGITTKGEYGGG